MYKAPLPLQITASSPVAGKRVQSPKAGLLAIMQFSQLRFSGPGSKEVLKRVRINQVKHLGLQRLSCDLP